MHSDRLRSRGTLWSSRLQALGSRLSVLTTCLIILTEAKDLLFLAAPQLLICRRKFLGFAFYLPYTLRDVNSELFRLRELAFSAPKEICLLPIFPKHFCTFVG